MIVGTRGSELALAQTRAFVSAVRAASDIDPEVVVVSTTGDRVTDRPLADIGGYGAFVRELDARIVSGEIDVSVNSLKDVPVLMRDGLSMPMVLPRGPAEDVMLPMPLDELPEGAKVGTSSVRRAAMLLNARPDLRIEDIRGNVPTRVRKVREGEYDAIVLAEAGLRRLGIEDERHPLDTDVFVPSPAQGAIGVVCATGSTHIPLLESLSDDDTMRAVLVERRVMRYLGAGCSSPVGIHARREGDGLRLRASLLSRDGSRRADVDISLERWTEADLMGVAESLKNGLGG